MLRQGREAGCWSSCARRPGGILADTYRELNPAAIQREIQALTEQLLTITTSKKGPGHKPPTRVSIYARIHR